MSDHKVLPTVNGIPVALSTHQHDYLTNVGTSNTDAYIENVNDTYGPVRMSMQNRTGVNGVLYEQKGTVDLIDFVFKSLTQQSNIRLESRPTYLNNVANTTGEWQFGPPVLGTQWLTLGEYENLLGTATRCLGTLSATNLKADGFSTNVAPIKVYTSTTQTISATTNTKVVFGTISHAPIAACWVAATNRYVAQSTGIFKVACSLRYTGTNRNNKVMLYKNGTFYASLVDYNTTNLATPFMGGSTDISLVATDYLEIWIYCSATVTIASGLDTNLCISRIY